jgi:hypothetical protein
MPISHEKRVQTIALCRSIARTLVDNVEVPLRRSDFGEAPRFLFTSVMDRLVATGCVVMTEGNGYSGAGRDWHLDSEELSSTIFERIASSDEDAVRVLWPPVDEAPVEEPAAEEATEPEALAEEPASQEQLVELIASVLQGFKASIESIDAKVGGAFSELSSLVVKLNAERPPPAPVSSMDESVADLVLTAVAENTEAVKKLTEKTGELNFLLSKFTSGANSLQAERSALREDVFSMTKTMGMLREEMKRDRADYLTDEHLKFDTLEALANKQDAVVHAIMHHKESLVVTHANQEVVLKGLVNLRNNIRDSFDTLFIALSRVSKGAVFDVEQRPQVEVAPKVVDKANGKKKLPTLSKIVAQKVEKKAIAYQESVVERILALPESVKSNITMDPDINAPVYKPKYALITPQKEDAK